MPRKFKAKLIELTHVVTLLAKNLMELDSVVPPGANPADDKSLEEVSDQLQNEIGRLKMWADNIKLAADYKKRGTLDIGRQPN